MSGNFAPNGSASDNNLPTQYEQGFLAVLLTYDRRPFMFGVIASIPKELPVLGICLHGVPSSHSFGVSVYEPTRVRLIQQLAPYSQRMPRTIGE